MVQTVFVCMYPKSKNKKLKINMLTITVNIALMSLLVKL